MALEEDIIKTIEYAKKFNCDLNAAEIKERLISNKVYSEKEINKKIVGNRHACSLPVELNQKMETAQEFVDLIKNKFKDILFMGITGSVAAGHPNKNDDIDLMIITKKNKLWLTRLKMRYFIYKNSIPHRKYGKKENKNELCFNLWLDESHLELPSNRHNLRCAVDLILMKAIMNRENIYERFIAENSWAKKWVANGYKKKTKPFGTSYHLSLDRAPLFFSLIINFLVFVPQYLFMKRKMKSEDVGLGYALFNEKIKKY